VTLNFEPGDVDSSELLAQARSRAVLAPFTLDLGGDTEISGMFTSDDYRFGVNGRIDWQRLLQLARAMGLNAPQTDLHGSGLLTASYSGEWRHFAPPNITAQAQVRSATLSLPGFSEPLHVSGGRLTMDGASFRADQISGSFPKRKIEFAGTFSGSRQCERHLLCDVSFSVQADELKEASLRELLTVPDSGIGLPFFASARRFRANWLLDAPSRGTISVRRLALQDLHAGNVTAELQFGASKVLVRQWTADLLGGKYSGELALDASGPQLAVTSVGSIRGARLDQVNAAFSQRIGVGTLDCNYQVTMSGADAAQIASSMVASGAFFWHNGSIQPVSEDADSPPLTFTSWSGHFAVAKQHVALERTKMLSTSGMREISGEAAFGREWNLKLVGAEGEPNLASAPISAVAPSRQQAKLDQSR